jgi:hypothetical protein
MGFLTVHTISFKKLKIFLTRLKRAMTRAMAQGQKDKPLQNPRHIGGSRD